MGQNSKDLILSKFKDQLKNAPSPDIFELKDFVENFLGQFISPETKRAYLKDLQAFFVFFKEMDEPLAHPSHISAQHFQVYRDYLTEEGLSSSTINRRLVGIRSFIKWCLASGYIQKNPLDRVKLPKVQTEKPTQALDDHEVLLMLDSTDQTRIKGVTHRLIMIMLFNLGLRRGELAKIKLKDLSYTRGHHTLKIRGKGSKIRVLPVSAQLQKEIEYYLRAKSVSGISLKEEDFLIQVHDKKKSHKPIDGSTIYRIIRKYATKAGIQRDISPHSCRATVISHLLDTQKTPIRDVAIFAGHSNITTTERYDKRRDNLDNSAAYQVDFGKKAS